MPPLNETVNANITRIDAPFPEQWREEFSEFTNDLKAIKELLTVTAASLTTSTEAQQALINLYSKESLTERASQAIASEQSQQRILGPNGEDLLASRPPAPATPEEEQQNQEKQEPSKPESLLDKEISMPQHFGGKYTAQDLLILAGKSARADTPFGIGEQPEAAAKFEKWAKKAPYVEAGVNLAKTYLGGFGRSIGGFRAQSEGLNQYSGSLGFEPGEGFLGMNDISGPFGTNFRMPLLNSGALSGIQQTGEAYAQALTVPGLSGPQAMAMNQSLAERGWFPGQEGQQSLFDAQAQLIGKGGVFQQLGEDPEVADLLDRAMRSGTAGADEMVRSIEEIPEAAKHAHEGIGQMVASMNSMGEFSQSQGGTHYAGQQQALELANRLGMPVAATKGYLESPWAQSAIFRATGMPSWMQGTVPGAIKNEAAMQGFRQLARAVGKGEGHTYKSGGFEEYVSPLEEQAAKIHMIEPNMNPETIKRLLKQDPHREKVTGEIQRQAEMWEKTSQGVMKDGSFEQQNQYLTASNVGGKNFGRLLKNMMEQRTSDGRPMFSHEDIKDIRTNYGHGYDAHGQELVEKKYANVQKILGTKSGKAANAAGSPGDVMIELSPQARKWLQLPNKRSRIKVEAGASENSTVNAFSGATEPLVPGTNNLTMGGQYIP